MNTQPNIFESYHNTTREAGKLLATYSDIAKAQDIKVLRFFQTHPNIAYSPYQVHEAVAKNNEPLTSIRRSINTLTNEGYLVDTRVKKVGHLGRKTSSWKLKTKQDENSFK